MWTPGLQKPWITASWWGHGGDFTVLLICTAWEGLSKARGLPGSWANPFLSQTLLAHFSPKLYLAGAERQGFIRNHWFSLLLSITSVPKEWKCSNREQEHCWELSSRHRFPFATQSYRIGQETQATHTEAVPALVKDKYKDLSEIITDNKMYVFCALIQYVYWGVLIWKL